jgi:hypothetical protein
MRTGLLITGLVAGFLLGAAFKAFAQPPTEVIPETQIYLGVGQTRVYRFDAVIGRVNILTAGTVTAAAQTDHQISVSGEAPGETQIIVFSPEGARLLEAIVTVTVERGHQVKIYGTGKNDDANAGFNLVYCNELGCGRPDRDLPIPTISVERVTRGANELRGR